MPKHELWLQRSRTKLPRIADFLCLRFPQHGVDEQRCSQLPSLFKKQKKTVSSYSSRQRIHRINQKCRNQGIALRTAPLSPRPAAGKARPRADTPAPPAPFSSSRYHPRRTHPSDRKLNPLLNQRRCKNTEILVTI